MCEFQDLRDNPEEMEQPEYLYECVYCGNIEPEPKDFECPQCHHPLVAIRVEG